MLHASQHVTPNGLNVTFGEASWDTYNVPVDMWPTPRPKYTPGYRHPESISSLDAKDRAWAALLRAATLACELYPDTGVLFPAMPLPGADDEPCGPVAWVAVTGCGFDLKSHKDIPESYRKFI